MRRCLTACVVLCFAVTADGRAVKEVGGEEVGSPRRKKDAKQELGRLRRRIMNQIPAE